MSRWGIALLGCLLLGGVANANPAFSTMDRGDGQSRIGLDMSVTFFDEDMLGDDATGFRFDMHGQYIDPTGFGGYALLPLSYGAFDTDAIDSEVALGNMELGGLYVIPTPRVSFVVRGGFTLPTADDELDAFFANAFGVRPRGTDVATIFPDTFWLRLSGSALVRQNNLFARADLGFDVPLDDEAEIQAGIFTATVEVDPLIRFNVGGGVIAGPAAIMLELVNLVNTADNDGDPNTEDDDFEHNIALSGRFIEGKVQPSVSIVLALDESARDDIDFMFMLGVQGELPSAVVGN